MAEDADSKEDQFDFTSQGEAMGYISIGLHLHRPSQASGYADRQGDTR